MSTRTHILDVTPKNIKRAIEGGDWLALAESTTSVIAGIAGVFPPPYGPAVGVFATLVSTILGLCQPSSLDAHAKIVNEITKVVR